MSQLEINLAAEADLPAINAIYNHYVTTSTANYALTPMSAEDRHKWLAAREPIFAELRNCIDYAVAVARYDHLTESDLPDAIKAKPAPSLARGDDDLRWDTVERRHIEAVLRSVTGNRAHAARLLGIDRKTLHRKLERMNIDVPPRTRSGTRPREQGVEGEPTGAVSQPTGTEGSPPPSSDGDPQSTRYRFIFR